MILNMALLSKLVAPLFSSADHVQSPSPMVLKLLLSADPLELTCVNFMNCILFHPFG